MILADKIISLRKKLGWSQEQLAQELGVSRQSVSKWESSMSIPELDKIIMMSSLFGVSTDYLLKDELGEEAPAEGRSYDEEEGRLISVEEANTYMELCKSCGKKIACAVLIFILSPVLLIFLAGLADCGVVSEGLAAGIGLCVLLIMVAVGVVICIVFGLRLGKYSYMEEEPVTLQYGVRGIVEKKKEGFEQTFQTGMAISVALIIVSVIPLIVGSCMGVSGMLEISFVCLVMIVTAGAVYNIVKVCYVWGSYQKLLQESDYSRESKRFNKKFEAFSSAYWCIVTAIYLAVSFICQNWHISWVIWPVAGVLYGVIDAIGKVIYTKEDK